LLPAYSYNNSWDNHSIVIVHGSLCKEKENKLDIIPICSDLQFEINKNCLDSCDNGNFVPIEEEKEEEKQEIPDFQFEVNENCLDSCENGNFVPIKEEKEEEQDITPIPPDFQFEVNENCMDVEGAILSENQVESGGSSDGSSNDYY